MSENSGLSPEQIAALSGLTAAQIAEVSTSWAPESRTAMLEYFRAAQKREAIRKRYRDVADLAAAVDPSFVITRAVRLIAQRIEKVLHNPRHNLLVTAPPQELKSTLCAIFTPVRALQENPNTKIILATYAEPLALDHSRACRSIIQRHGSGVVDDMIGAEVEDKLGFRVSPTATKVNSWQVDNGLGGLVAVGLHGTVTGRGADLLIIDDPYKDMAEADSEAGRASVDQWMRTVARQRLSPRASIILIQTRWHAQDLAGDILAKERLLPPRYRTWHHVNIPAIAEEGIDDALNRPPGEALESALGRTKEEYEATKRDIGDRVWYAMYQGNPRNPTGGLFQQAWFTPHAEVPERPVAAIVAIDPADSGRNDDAGIVGGYLCPNGTVLLAEDWSGQYTSDQWSRQAVLLALEMNAREIAMEAYTAATTYEAVIKRAWEDLRREARKKQFAGDELTTAEQRALSARMPFSIYKWRGRNKADAVARSALLRQALETGKARTVPHKMAVLESQAIGWHPTQHQPDRLAAAVIVHDRLIALGSGRFTAASPVLGQRPMNAPDWMRRRLTR